jgi:hypothetical protein
MCQFSSGRLVFAARFAHRVQGPRGIAGNTAPALLFLMVAAACPGRELTARVAGKPN